MKVVVIGGTGLIGSKVVEILGREGHEVVAASPDKGVNALTGQGLSEALEGADVVVDVSNSPSFDAEPAMAFFTTAGKNLADAEVAAGVKHHVALSVVGTDRLQDSGYFRAKLAQEELIKSSPIPYTLVRATQFYEFIRGIAQSATDEDNVRLPHALFQPMAAQDVAGFLAKAATDEPLNRTVELAGPEKFRMDEITARVLAFDNDPRTVTMDPQATYFGLKVDDQSLVPGPEASVGPTAFTSWLKNTESPTVSASAAARTGTPARA